MPLDLPDLDDRTYADLVEEARRLIPSYDPTWTNHNPSDPGVTLVELFAYLSEMLLYRLNRVTEANQVKFLKLLNGPDWSLAPGEDLTSATRAAVQSVRARFRAVSTADYERIALDDFNPFLAAMQRAEAAGGSIQAWWDQTKLDPQVDANKPSKVPAVTRARCFSGQNLDRGREADRVAPAPGHVSLMVTTGGEHPLAPPGPLLAALQGFLDERRVLTTTHHVVGPVHADIQLDVALARVGDVHEEDVRAAVQKAVGDFLHPLGGGPSREGWPFGRDVYVSELIERLEAIPWVDYVTDLTPSSACAGDDDRCVPAVPLWHDEGDLIGLRLEDHHLPRFTDEKSRIIIAPHAAFVPVKVTVTVTEADDPPTVKQRVKAAIRQALYGRWTQDTTIKFSSLVSALGAVQVTATVAVDVDRSRLDPPTGFPTGFNVRVGEVINWRTVITGAV